MKTLCEYLNDAKTVTGSDYATEKRIEITRQALNQARKTGRISAETAVKLAGILGVETMQIIAASEVQKAPEKAPFWAKFSAACCVGLGLILSLEVKTENAFKSGVYIANEAAKTVGDLALYILCSIVKALIIKGQEQHRVFRVCA